MYQRIEVQFKRQTWNQRKQEILTSEDMEDTPLESRIFRMNFMSGLFSSKTLVSI